MPTQPVLDFLRPYWDELQPYWDQVLKPHWELARQWLVDYWHSPGAYVQIFFYAGGLLLAYLAMKGAQWTWVRRSFLQRVNFSLNYVDQNKLKIRTIKEADVDQIILNNKFGKRVVIRAARRVSRWWWFSRQRPFLKLPKKHAWVVLNSVLNEISQLCPFGPVAESMGMPTRSARYVFGLTCEWGTSAKVRKIRVLIVREDLLKGIREVPNLDFEREWHRSRLETLKKMGELYEQDLREEEREQKGKRSRGKARRPRRRNLMPVELAIPDFSQHA